MNEYWIPQKLEGSAPLLAPTKVVSSNVWLKRKHDAEHTGNWGMNSWSAPIMHDQNTNILGLKEKMELSLWVEDARGRQPIIPIRYTYGEVMRFHFDGDTAVSGFSLWLGEQEVFWQRFHWGCYTVPSGGHLEVDLRPLKLEWIPHTLS